MSAKTYLGLIFLVFVGCQSLQNQPSQKLSGSDDSQLARADGSVSEAAIVDSQRPPVLYENGRRIDAVIKLDEEEPLPENFDRETEDFLRQTGPPCHAFHLGGFRLFGGIQDPEILKKYQHEVFSPRPGHEADLSVWFNTGVMNSQRGQYYWTGLDANLDLDYNMFLSFRHTWNRSEERTSAYVSKDMACDTGLGIGWQPVDELTFVLYPLDWEYSRNSKYAVSTETWSPLAAINANVNLHGRHWLIGQSLWRFKEKDSIVWSRSRLMYGYTALDTPLVQLRLGLDGEGYMGHNVKSADTQGGIIAQIFADVPIGDDFRGRALLEGGIREYDGKWIGVSFELIRW